MNSLIFRDKEELIRELIGPKNIVLDVGFWGQGVNLDNPHWVHNLLRGRAHEVWGIDLEYDEKRLPQDARYYANVSAEAFNLPQTFDVILAADLIEHLPNPGLFLERVKKHLKPGGRLILTTPNCFNLFSIAEKISKGEPTVNKDHTCYFNDKTLRQLLGKCGFENVSFGYVWWLGMEHEESLKKKILNVIYLIVGRLNPRYLETLVAVARP